MNNVKKIGDEGAYVAVDTKKCQGCLTCMLACSLAHEGALDLTGSRIQVVQSSFERYPGDIATLLRESCDLCEQTPFWDSDGGEEGRQVCVAVCPLGAVRLLHAADDTAAGRRTDVNFRGRGWKKIGYPID